VIFVRKERRTVESKANDKGWSRMVANVKRITPILPMVQVRPEIHSIVRSFLAEVESFPWESRSRKPIANSDPTTAKLPIRDRYLKIVLKAIIVP
jgi:hypothetical protein